MKFRCKEMSPWKYKEIKKLLNNHDIVINGSREKGETDFSYEVVGVEHNDVIARQIEELEDLNLEVIETQEDRVRSIVNLQLRKIIKNLINRVKALEAGGN